MRNFGRTVRSLAAGTTALVCLSAPAFAEEFEWSVTGTGTSDYIFRGLSLNNENPAFQASIDASYGIFYAGVWGTMVDDGDYEPVELDLYAGIKPVWGPVTFDFGFVYYIYPWASSPSDISQIELKAGAEFSPFTNFTLKPVFWYVPEQDNVDEDLYTIEGTAAYELPAFGIFTPTISGLIGYTDSNEAEFFAAGKNSYTYWNAGVALSVEKFTFDFRYWDTDLDSVAGDGYYGLDDERFVFTASVTLP
jgi:uncharacterized protein (TIGR02001 family)